MQNPSVSLNCLLVAASLLLWETAASAADIDYEKQIRPLLRERCLACHGALRQQGGLRIDTVAALLQGGDSGPAIQLGKAVASELIARVQAADESLRMPREGRALSADEIGLLTRWIQAGAPHPENETPDQNPGEHWAFRVPVRPDTPPAQDQAIEPNRSFDSPIDAFLAQHQETAGLVPQREAEKHIQLRRIYLDLIGLPPTPRQLEAFLADDSAGAWSRVVDQLLASPQYGQRWARHWMDVWRYSDWYGRRSQKDVRNSYPHIWRWRDWIIQSLNQDKGYDRMVIEMLAADEVAPDDYDTLVATGFIARNWFSLNTDQWMKDLVEHTGKAFLGLTLNCAHCHDHKYDPISQREYFAFRAFFEPLQMRHDRVPGGGQLAKLIPYDAPGSPNPRVAIEAGMVRVFDEDLEAKTFLYQGGDARNKQTDQPPVAPAGPAILGGDQLDIVPISLPRKAWYPGLREFALNEDLQARRAAMNSLMGSDGIQLAAAKARYESLQQRIAAEQERTSDKPENADVAQAEREANVLAAKAAVESAEVAVKNAQDDKSKKAAEENLKKAKSRLAAAEKASQSESKEYTTLGPTYPRTSTGRRTALAKWIASRENPLTARVAVNHIWARHFYVPIVDPVYDFGINGGKPRFPKLLDWLAVEFIESGWSMKHIHRLIVTSAAYRRDSSSFPEGHRNLDLDPDNQLLWRKNAHRMEAEVIRDSILHAADQLDMTVGGQELPNSQAEISHRRSLYFETFPEGAGSGEFAALFDAPDPCDCYRRTESQVPQQALALMNSRLTINQSRRLAKALTARVGNDETAFVRAAFKTIISRHPSDAELNACQKHLQQQRELYDGQDLKALADRRLSTVVSAANDPHQRARESLVQALFSHHEFANVR